MAKPTSQPSWTASGTTPSAGEKSGGFSPQDRLPAQYVNWFWELVSSWITWLFVGVLNRASLADDTPVLSTADHDSNIKSWLDANGYTFGNILRADYWWKVDSSVGSYENMSLGDPMYRTASETGFAVTVDMSTAVYNFGINAAMVELSCPAAPTAQNGIIISTDDNSSGNGVAFRCRDSIAVLEGTFVCDENPLTTASSFYFGFSDVQQPDQWENSSVPCALVILDHGESVFEGMSCTGAALSKATTGETCAVDTLYHLRVELHNATTPQGVDNGGTVMKVFIDGDLVLTKTTNPPGDSATLKPCFGVQGLGSDTANSFFVGPVHFAVNYLTSSQTPN